MDNSRNWIFPIQYFLKKSSDLLQVNKYLMNAYQKPEGAEALKLNYVSALMELIMGCGG